MSYTPISSLLSNMHKIFCNILVNFNHFINHVVISVASICMNDLGLSAFNQYFSSLK